MKNFNHRLLKKASMIAVSLLLLSSVSFSQNSVSIGSENIKNSAVLYLQGNGSQGLIIPIVSNVSGIAAPEAGMIVYQSSDSQVYYHNGTSWSAFSGGGGTDSQTLTISGNTLSITNGNSVSLSGANPSTAGQLFMWDGTQWTASKTTAPTTGQVLQWDGTTWEPATIAGGTAYTAGSGINIDGSNVISNTGDTDATDDITDATTLGGDLAGTLPNPTIANGAVSDAKILNVAPSKLTQEGASVGQVLKWNGTSWAVANDDTGGGAAPTLSDGQLMIGDGTSNTAGTVSGDLTLSGSNFAIANNAVTDAKILDVAPSKITQAGAINGQVLQWNTGAGQWQPATVSVTAINSLSDLTDANVTAPLNGQILAYNTGNLRFENRALAVGDIPNLTLSKITDAGALAAANDVSSAQIVDGTISAADLNDMGAGVGQVLEWNGTSWAPATVAGGGTDDQLLTYTPATNILSIEDGNTVDLSDLQQGLSLLNAGTSRTIDITDGTGITLDVADNDNDSANELQSLSLTGTDITLSNGGGTVSVNDADSDATNELISGVAVTGNLIEVTDAGGTQSAALSGVAPASGQVLKWNGSAWEAAADDVGGGGLPALANAQIVTNDGASNVPVTVGGDVEMDNTGSVNILNIQGSPVSIGSPASGQVLKWDGAQWAPGTDDVGGGGLPALTDAQLVTNNGSNVAVTVSGDVTFANDGTVTISNDAVTSAKIADGGITDADISDVDNSKVSGLGALALLGSVGSTEITDGAVTSADIANGTISNIDIADVDPAKINQAGATPSQVLKWDGAQWAPGLDDTGAGVALANAQVITNDGISDVAVTVSGDVTFANDGTITISAGAVNSAKIADGSITDADISDVDNSKVTGLGALALLGTVGSAEIIDGSVTSADIADLTISSVDISDIDPSKLNQSGATPSQVLKWDGAQWAPAADDTGASVVLTNAQLITNDGATDIAVTVSGDVTLANDGTITISNDAVNSAKIADGSIIDADIADVDNSKVTGLGALALLGTVGSAEITDGSVTSADIADLTISSVDISDIDPSKLNQSGATPSQVLKWDGAQWAPAADDTGASVVLTNAQLITNDGATDIAVTVSGDVTLANDGTITISADAVNSAKIADGSITDADIADVDNTKVTGLGALALLGTVGSTEITDASILAADLNDMGAASGDALVWDGAAWVPTATGGTSLLDTEIPVANGGVFVASNLSDNGSSINSALSLNLAAGAGIQSNGSAVMSFDPTGANYALGDAAGGSITTGIENTFLGKLTGASTTTGNGNVFAGKQAGSSNTTGLSNTFVGSYSGTNNVDGGRNTFIGGRAGQTNIAGNFLTLLGENSDVAADGLSMSTAIGYGAIVDASNRIVLGSSGTDVQFDGELRPADDPGTAGQVLTSAGPGATPTWTSGGSGWGLTGNAGTVDGTNFIGTTDNVPFNIRVNNLNSGRIDPAGPTFFGYQAGDVNTSTTSTGFGFGALASNTSGANNTANGWRALFTNTTGTNNTSNGVDALYLNTTGYSNTATGSYSLRSNTIGFENTATGLDALWNNISGQTNTATGVGALRNNTTGNSNVAVGANALQNNTTANENIAIGSAALSSNTTAIYNTAIGTAALSASNASNNTAVGFYALRQNTFGAGNVAVGDGALDFNQTGSFNTGVGSGALQNNLGSSSTGIGSQALFNNTTGVNNVGVGANALASNTTASENVALGTSALGVNTIGGQNTAIGHASMNANVDGAANVGLGLNSLFSSTSGFANTALGYSALIASTSDENTAVGYNTLAATTTGAFNVAVGSSAMDANTTGFHNVAIGYNADVSSPGLNNAIAIGANSIVDASNKMVLGVSGTSIQFDGELLPAGAAGTAGQVLTSAGPGATPTWSAAGGSGWGLLGNAGTVDGTDFIGTTDDVPVNFRMFNQPAGRIDDATTGNTGFGYQAGNVGNGFNNASFGFRAMPANTADGNAAFGSTAMENLVTGTANTGVGYAALRDNDGVQNTAVGNASQRLNTSGNDNVSVGFLSLLNNTTASGNSAIGSNALQNSTGEGNTALGYATLLANTTGTFNIGIGHSANVATPGLTNAIAIGANSIVDASNKMVLGSAGTSIQFDGELLPAGASGAVGEVLTSAGPGATPTWSASGSSSLQGAYDGGSTITMAAGVDLAIETASAVPILTLDEVNGYVGMGTGTPAAGLDVVTSGATAISGSTDSNVSGDYAVSGINTGTGDVAGFFHASNAAGGVDSHGVYGQADGQGAGVMGGNGGTTGVAGRFMNFNAGNANPVVEILNSGTGPSLVTAGLAGIGNTTPAFMLDVEGDVNVRTTGNYMWDGAVVLSGGNGNVLLGGNTINTGIGNVLLKGGGGTTGNYNVIGGNNAGFNNAAGNDNIFFGTNSGSENTSGSSNIFIGSNAAGIGSLHQTGGNNILIGSSTNLLADGLSNSVAIGSGASVGTSNSIVLGNGANVGIGISSPHAELQLPTTTANRKLVLFEGADNDHEFFGLGVNGAALRYQINGTFSDHIFYASTNSTTSNELMRIGGDGNVGIGEAAPTEVLDVAGNVKFSGAIMPNNLPGAAGEVLTSAGPGVAPTWASVGASPLISDTGNENIFVGANSGTANTGEYQTFVGFNSGNSNTDGFWNTFIGHSAGFSNTTGDYNTYIGNFAGRDNVAGIDNTFVGEDAGSFGTTGTANTFIGMSAGQFASGNLNTLVGEKAGNVLTSGSSNTYLGRLTGQNNITGSTITLIGTASDTGVDGLTNATAIGANAIVNANDRLVLGATGTDVQFDGELRPADDPGTVGQFLTSGGPGVTPTWTSTAASLISDAGPNNIFVGNSVGTSTTGNNNTFVGDFSGADNTTGTDNVYVGTIAGQLNLTGGFNVFVGRGAGSTMTSGGLNTIIGFNSGSNSNGASGNTFVGGTSGQNSTSGLNTLIGEKAGTNLTTGGTNTYLGRQTGVNNTTGWYNTFLGSEATSTVDGLFRSAAIGYNAQVSQSNAMALGGTGADAVNVGIGTGAPQAVLEVIGSTSLGSNTSVGTNAHVIGVTNTVADDGFAFGVDNIVGSYGGIAIGSNNTIAGNRGIAIGSRVEPNHLGTVLIGDWSGSSPGLTASSTSDQFTARFSNGYRFYTSSDPITNPTEAVFLNSTGLGVDRSAAVNALEVNGNASKTTATAWLANSDRRIKTDIQDIEGSLETMMKLRPVKFKYTQEWMDRYPTIEDRYYHNFIAQEYQEVFPNAVKGSGEYVEGDGNEVLQIDTYDAQITTIKAVQELIKKVETLEKENTELKTELAESKASISELSAKTAQNSEVSSNTSEIERLKAELASIKSLLLNNAEKAKEDK